MSFARLKLIYYPDGFQEIMDRYCHIAMEAVHHGLRLARDRKLTDVEQDHYKFYDVQHAIQDLPVEIGNQFSGRLSTHSAW